MTDIDIRDALDRATRHLDTSPDLLDSIRAGGRRRLVRRRSLLAAGLATVTAGSAAAAWRLDLTDGGTPVAAPLLFDNPTRGDLAGDTAYLNRVQSVWRKRMRAADIDTIGSPHIIWAGSTPAGPAAAVVQRSHPSMVQSSDGDVDFAVIGMAEPTDGGPSIPEIVTLTRRWETEFHRSALVVGPQRDVLVVLDLGRPVQMSPSYRYGDDGRIVRSFRTLTFNDGAAVVRIPPQRPELTLALKRAPFATRHDVVELANFDELAYGGRTGGGFPVQLDRALPGHEAAWPPDPILRAEDPPWGSEALAPWEDPFGMGRFDGVPDWFIFGATPDRRRFVVKTTHTNADPLRLFAIVGTARDRTPSVTYGGFVDRTAPLPIRMRLPDRQGLVVAAEGAALRYRVKGGDWLPASGDAALLPHATTEVEVTRPGGAPVRVSVR